LEADRRVAVRRSTGSGSRRGNSRQPGRHGNLVVITTVTVKHIRRRRTTGNDVGGAFIANLASSDLIVTSVINPLAIAGLSSKTSKILIKFK